MRGDGRRADETRPVRIETHVNRYAEGSCIFSMGDTRVHCTASIEENVPRWLRDSGRGWVTAEYRMLPRATDTRTRREGDKLKGRTSEIQRLIGRSLRAAVDLEALGPLQITIDCDVLLADGGTRTASINGGYVALVLALRGLVAANKIDTVPLLHHVCALSVGVVDGQVVADLPYEEDSRAEVDLNLVMTADGALIEVQGTAEGAPFSRAQLTAMVDIGHLGLAGVAEAQRAALA